MAETAKPGAEKKRASNDGNDDVNDDASSSSQPNRKKRRHNSRGGGGGGGGEQRTLTSYVGHEVRPRPGPARGSDQSSCSAGGSGKRLRVDAHVTALPPTVASRLGRRTTRVGGSGGGSNGSGDIGSGVTPSPCQPASLAQCGRGGVHDAIPCTPTPVAAAVENGGFIGDAVDESIGAMFETGAAEEGGGGGKGLSSADNGALPPSPPTTNPADGILDLDAAPTVYASRRVPTHEEALEASYLATYGREYYRHLFEAERRHGDRPRRRSELHEEQDWSLGAAEEEEADAAAAAVVVPSSATTAPSSSSVGQFPEATTLRTVTLEGHHSDQTTAAAVAANTSSSASEVPSFLADQPHVTPPMREVLVDWLAELCHEYKASSMTLHVAVRLVDRVLRRTARQHTDAVAVAVAEASSRTTEHGSAAAAVWTIQRGEFQCVGW